MPKKFWYIIIGAVGALIIFPVVIDWLIIGNNVPSNINNSDWVNFLGGYIGAILGCAISLIGIIWTINFTREQNRTDRELQIRPYFDIRYIPSTNKIPSNVDWLGYVMMNEYDECEADSKEVERGILFLSNVGNGPATKIKVDVLVENIKVDYRARFSNKNTKVTSNSVQQGREAAITFMIFNNRVTPTENDLIWDEDGRFAYCDSTRFETPLPYNLIILLTFNDLLGNTFTQKLKFNMSYEMSYNRSGGKYVCSPDLVEIGFPQKK